MDTRAEANATVASALSAVGRGDPKETASVSAAMRKFAPDYVAKYARKIPPHHRHVLGLIVRCKTGALGNFVYRCESCRRHHWVGRSCGNRHCPNCQKEKTQAWLARQSRKLLPVQHFAVTFTVPKELRMLLRANPEVGHNAIFAAGSQTIRKLLKNPKNLGSDQIGFFGVLHTWGRDLKDYHPHVHFVLPGGGVSPEWFTMVAGPPRPVVPSETREDALQKTLRRRAEEGGPVREVAAGCVEVRLGGEYQTGR